MGEEWIGVSILAEDQEAYSRRFADPDADRFDDLEVQRGMHGTALLVGAAAHLRSLADVSRSNRLFGGRRAAVAAVNPAIAFHSGTRSLLDVGTGLADIP